MSFKTETNKNNSFSDKDKNVDKSVSEAINEAFDHVELSTVGKLCLDARLNKGLTQEQAGALLKVRVKIIKDFENGEHIDLPGLAYKVGFVRSYARLLDLDGDLLVKEFKESLELNSFKEEYKFLTPELNKNNIIPIGAVVSVFIAILSYTGWYYSDRSNKIEEVSDKKIVEMSSKISEIDNNSYVIIEENFSNDLLSSKRNDDEKKVQEVNRKTNLKDDQVESITIKNTELSATANERDPSTEMVLKAIGNSWVEIEDVDGNILMTRLMRPGETYVVPNINGLTFNTGNAGALSLSQGNVIVPKLGEVGEIITARPLNIKTFSNKQILD
jgi:cytoskeleton protein RodZ